MDLQEYIRSLVRELLDEESATGAIGVGAGPIMTPFAFARKGQGKNAATKTAEKQGFKVTKGETEMPADSKVRERIVNSLPKETKYFTYIHSTAQIHGADVYIGEGSIICAGTIITCNVKIGKHSHLNFITTIGHDNIIGDYFTTAPGVQISGNCVIGDRVYFEWHSAQKKLKVGDDFYVILTEQDILFVEED